MNTAQKALVNNLRAIYKRHNLKRHFNPTKDGKGVYVHPQSGAFFRVGGKRMGIFILTEEPLIEQYLLTTDDELAAQKRVD